MSCLLEIRELHHTYMAGTSLETVALRGADLDLEALRIYPDRWLSKPDVEP